MGTNFPGTPLKQGDNNENVVAMQQQLNEKKFGPIATDGDFGPHTLSEVEAFQSANHLSVDGVVGQQTWDALFSAATVRQPNEFSDLVNVPFEVIRGVDISHYDVPVDWSAIVNSGATFVYIKVSDGIGTPDETASKNANDAKANNLKIGYYHFCWPKTRGGTVSAAAIAEANDTLNVLKGLPPADLPLMLDLETTKPDSPLAPADYLLWINSFIGALPQPANVLIYTYASYINSKLPHPHNLGQYPLWLARYRNDYNFATPAEGWEKWDIWQFEGAGVLGNNANIDLDVMRADFMSPAV